MKRKLHQLLLLSMFLPAALSAQITITSGDLPTIGLQVITAVDDVTQISPGNPGLNQVWDFSNLIPTKYDTLLYLPMDGKPNAGAYPGAEMAIKHLNGDMQIDYDYEYVRYSPEGLRYVGDEDLVTIFGDYKMAIHIATSPNPMQLRLPFTYGDTYTQNSVYDWTLAVRNAGVTTDSTRQISHMSITTLGDASGIMMTPYESFQVLRVKVDVVSQDSVFTWSNGAWVFSSAEVSEFSNYWWYTNDYYEVGYYNLDDEKGSTFKFFKSETVVGNSYMASDNGLKIYPNPASSQLNILTDTRYTHTEVLDASGRVVLSSDYHPFINVESLNPGLYILRLHDGNKVVSTRFVKQ